MSCLNDSNDHLRWLAPTDLKLDYMGITHLDCVTRVSRSSGYKNEDDNFKPDIQGEKV